MKAGSYSKNSVIPLSRQFEAAVDILNSEYGNLSKIRTYINDNSDVSLTASDFSKLSGAHRRNDYLTRSLQGKLKKVLEILEPFLNKEFNFFWDATKKKYVHQIDNRQDPRMEGLIGTYEGYSWDTIATKEMSTDYIHYFKVKIADINAIVCKTKGATFKGAKIEMITDDRISIEVFNSHRRVFLIIYIGNIALEDLRKKKTFKLAYCDSGTENIKSGLAILERTNAAYDDIEPISKPVSFFEATKSTSFIDFLRDAQLVLD